MDRRKSLITTVFLISSGLLFSPLTFAEGVMKSPSELSTSDSMSTEKNNLSDQKIKENVKSALESYGDKLYINVQDGVVSIQGRLASDIDYEKVIMLTESVSRDSAP